MIRILDTYKASFMFIWKQSGPDWLYLSPPTSGGAGLPTRAIQVGDLTIVISDVSDTLSVDSNSSTLFLTWVLVGFSVLMLQPILEAILLQEESPHRSSGQPQVQPESVQRAK